MSRFHQHDWDLLPERAFSLRGGRFGRGMTLEGGKGSSAPPPDPRLVEAQFRSMGIQDEAIQSVMELAQRMAPLQEEQMGFALDAQKTAFQQAQEDRTWSLDRRTALTGVQDQLIADARDFNTEARQGELVGQAVADVRGAFDTQRGMTSRQLARMGVNPNSGKFLATQNSMSIAEAAAAAGGANTARERGRMEGYALTDRATNALAGYPAMGMQATGASAGYGGAALDVANRGVAGLSSPYSSSAQIAGQMGANATNMWNAQADYKTQQDQIAASSDPFNTMLGAAAAVGTQWALMSDRRLKTGIVPVGRNERTGLTLYEFSYLGATDGKRYRGVMADEVERIAPEAVSYDDLGFASVDYARLGIEMVEV